ncbi:DUF1302 domain-containing protein [Pseudomonas sp. M30-35]|uniref:DUF1302 domain-containing protein n=1 Tax=Pseudomonas sp. M30-35 TaxID=1981174 RepID=UPI000B3C41F6|nr:DUF1302 domain-containing protein [Pseudomonas sp. M30-35]ARU87764.1 hypothetical protein B9K09_07185 [Pseudomonas sp. M30-35]
MNAMFCRQSSGSMRTIRTRRKRRGPELAAAGLAVLAALPLGVAQAYQFHSGDWAGSIDTTISYGVNYRVEGQDSKLIATANGGSAPNAKRINSDDGNLNFQKGELFSEVAKIVSELGLNYQGTYGLFLRGRAFYDFELKDDDRRHREITDDGLDDAGASAELLDAFVYGNWMFGERNLNARLGRQVVNWGEGLFYRSGINASNPVDLNALRAPGSEVKEALMPTFMTYASFQLNERLTLEGYYQPGWAWEKTKLDPCGTYFSSADIFGSGCDYLAVGTFDNPSMAGAPSVLFVPRTSDIDADSAAQFGAALRWFAQELNDTEFGLYYLRYSDQLPRFAATVSSRFGALPIPSTATYYAEYLEDRELYGMSFNTTILGEGIFSGQSLFGELSYRPNAPINLSNGTVLGAALLNPAGLPVGARVENLREKEMYQASLGTIRVGRGVLGSDSTTLIAELVANRVMGLESGPEYGDVTSSAYGATVNVSMNYTDVYRGINLVPTLSHARAFNGVAPALTNGLDEQAWSTSLGLEASYLDVLSLGVRYVDFTGGTSGDRDYLSFNVKYSF